MASSSKKMNPVDMKKVFPTLNHAQQFFVKKIEKENYSRALNVRNMRRRNAKWGLGLALFALSSYTYTMYAIRQEKYEEFDDEPTAEVKATT